MGLELDDSSLLEAIGYPVYVFEGDPRNIKIHDPVGPSGAGSDAAGPRTGPGRRASVTQPRIGAGFDSHQLVSDRPLVLGGVRIEHELGLLGHSDGDVLTHALIDAVLGAAGLGDIGQHFPDDDVAYQGADSVRLLAGRVRPGAGAAFAAGKRRCYDPGGSAATGPLP